MFALNPTVIFCMILHEREYPMDQPVLGDKNHFPAEEIIFSHLGKTKVLWQSFFEYLHAEHPDLSEEWRYYNDGKSWLMKVTRKSKTIFWLSIIPGAFRTTFYFTDKAADLIAGSFISKELKEQFISGQGTSMLRGLAVVFRGVNDIENAKALLAIKLGIR
jgi:hypothetical protein